MIRIRGIIASSLRKIPSTPTIGTATDVGTGRAYDNGAATVTFTPGPSTGFATTYYVKAYEGGVYSGISASGSSSPITVTGLKSVVAYTFKVYAENSIATSSESAASNSVTITTVPRDVSINGLSSSSTTTATLTISSTSASFTGGKAILSATAIPIPTLAVTTAINSSTSFTATGTYAKGQEYTFQITRTNANGTSNPVPIISTQPYITPNP